jgi:predicted RNase H-like HicB family nuclease
LEKIGKDLFGDRNFQRRVFPFLREKLISSKRFYGIMKKKMQGSRTMETKLKMVYWKSEKFWVGKLLDHPEIMTQGETLEELEENMKDAYMLMTMEDVPAHHEVKELAINV